MKNIVNKQQAQVNYTDHSKVRMQQRGLRTNDIDLVLNCAALVGDHVYFMRRKDVDREIAQRKQEIQSLERLCNQKLVVKSGNLVTCHSTRKAQQKGAMIHYRDQA